MGGKTTRIRAQQTANGPRRGAHQPLITSPTPAGATGVGKAGCQGGERPARLRSRRWRSKLSPPAAQGTPVWMRRRAPRQPTSPKPPRPPATYTRLYMIPERTEAELEGLALGVGVEHLAVLLEAPHIAHRHALAGARDAAVGLPHLHVVDLKPVLKHARLAGLAGAGRRRRRSRLLRRLRRRLRRLGRLLRRLGGLLRRLGRGRRLLLLGRRLVGRLRLLLLLRRLGRRRLLLADRLLLGGGRRLRGRLALVTRLGLGRREEGGGVSGASRNGISCYASRGGAATHAMPQRA